MITGRHRQGDAALSGMIITYHAASFVVLASKIRTNQSLLILIVAKLSFYEKQIFLERYSICHSLRDRAVPLHVSSARVHFLQSHMLILQ